jgi:hypothetical protein
MGAPAWSLADDVSGLERIWHRQRANVLITRPVAERQVQGVDGVTAKRVESSGKTARQHRVEQELHAAGG